MELASRLIRMFSFAGDTVLDPFLGIGSTTLASIKEGRSSIGNEIDSEYFELASRSIKQEAAMGRLFGATEADVERRDELIGT